MGTVIFGKAAENLVSIQKLSWGGTVLYFGIPALAMAAGYYLIMPALTNRGVLPYYAYSIALGLPLLGLLIASLIAFHLEGHPLTWDALMARFRYFPMTGKDWFWTGGVFVLEMAVYLLLVRVTGWLLEKDLIPLPQNLPEFIDPKTLWTAETLDKAAGGLRGNWGLLILTIALLVVNVIGEEFWWRGVVYPRQILAFGIWVWVIHGLFWTGFHAYKWWDLINLLPLSLGLSYVVYKTGNSTPALIIHTITNGVGIVPILLGVLGR